MDRRSTDSTQSRHSAQPSASPSKTVLKANWTDTNTRIFLQIMSEEIEDGNKVNGQFTAEGWRSICAKFEARTGLAYNKNQLKNRSSQLRVTYARWRKLNDNASGLGVDPETGAILAEDEWWDAQAKDDPEVLKFKNAPPKFLDLLSSCYDGTYASGSHTYIPYRYRGQSGVNEQPDVMTAGDAAADVQSGGQPEQRGLSTPGPSSGRPNSATKLGQLKRKCSLGGSSRLSSAEKISDNIEKIANAMEANTTAFEKHLSTEDPTVQELQDALELFNNLPGVPVGSDFHARSLKVLTDRLSRWMFVNVVSKWPEDAQKNWFLRNF